MNSKQVSTRPLGQRSIPSTFLFRPTNRSGYGKRNVNIRASNEKGTRISLSEFLNRKLHGSSALPRSLLGREKPVPLPIGHEGVSTCAEGEKVGRERGGADKDLALDIVLQQFGETKKGKENINTSAPQELACGSTDDKVESRKRLRVLGDDSEPKRRKVKTTANKDETVPLFNHYANGGGWWDCDMEGVDNEEVGCSDVWEGMGSTTLGALDWH